MANENANSQFKKSIICIICPKSCTISVDTSCLKDGGRPGMAELSGYGCKRGAGYALEECLNPVRTLTTTVRVINGHPSMAPVKSEKPLPKAMLLECMKVISSVEVTAPVKLGDIIVENILGTGINIIATGNIAAL